ncbi:hypothetical protein C8R44DRAFT_725520 [Mycena epipterygia]|nr:hypothetical protein C8R44DRAFT_725520 [Mycena epipterygia]
MYRREWKGGVLKVSIKKRTHSVSIAAQRPLAPELPHILAHSLEARVSIGNRGNEASGGAVAVGCGVSVQISGGEQVNFAVGRSGSDAQGDGAGRRQTECISGHARPGGERRTGATSRAEGGHSQDALGECNAGGCKKNGDELCRLFQQAGRKSAHRTRRIHRLIFASEVESELELALEL